MLDQSVRAAGANAATAAPRPQARAAGARSVAGKVTYLDITAPETPRIVIDRAKHRGVERNVPADLRTVPVQDARQRPEPFTLDENGFELVAASSAAPDLTDEAEIRAVYYPEAESLLKARTGAAEVVIFDHTIRTAGGPDGARKPVHDVHGDYTPRSGPQRVRDLIAPEDQARWLGGRFAIVNVWRSTGETVLSQPLAFVDGKTARDEDFVPIPLIYPDRRGEIFGFAYHEDHRWHYYPRMTREEAVLIKTYDSAEDGRVRFVAHAAFEDPSTPADAPPRQSIELRALLRFDGDA